jgi:carboxypeptidase Taq
MSQKSYDKLIEYTKQTSVLSSAASVLAWDRETYMPPKAAAHRAEQMALLAGMIHDRETAPEIEEWLSAVETEPIDTDPHSVPATNVRELRRSYDKQVKIPKDLVEAISRTTTLGNQAWAAAREASDFAQFCPHLSEIVNLQQQYADAIGYDTVRYDALLDDYEPGARSAEIAQVFAGLRQELVPLVDSIASAPKQPDRTILARNYSIEKQKTFAAMVASVMGYDFAAGRMDTVVHPFCTNLGPLDHRITARWNEKMLGSGLYSVLHEAGHAMYDQNRPTELWGTPAGGFASLGIHESQSRMWENAIGRSEPFWRYFYPLLQGVFASELGDVSLATFVHAVNDVQRSYIRVEADEGTYNLHIILRFELEQALIAGDLSAKDVPAAWNDAFRDIFGLEIPNDTDGCLQDVHWSFGAFGYFPTYTLGNLYAAQIHNAAQQQIAEFDDALAAGRLGVLSAWLREHVHQPAKRYQADELLLRITGEPLSPTYLIESLTAKYRALYGV